MTQAIGFPLLNLKAHPAPSASCWRDHGLVGREPRACAVATGLKHILGALVATLGGLSSLVYWRGWAYLSSPCCLVASLCLESCPQGNLASYSSLASET